MRCFCRERGIDGRDLRYHGDARELRRRARENKREIDRLAERHADVRLVYRGVADGPRRYVVIAERKKCCYEHALVAGFDGARIIRLGVADRDEDGDGLAARVCGQAANDAGGCLRLCVKECWSEREGREEKKESQR